jgi:magnesium chelatase family protein
VALARLISRGQSGLEAFEVSVEVHLAGGLPAFTITGLPAPAVRESRDRVRAALQNCGIDLPASRITAHLGPADIPKQGGRFDLAIALGIIKARQRKSWRLTETEFLGELSLGGELRPVTGIVPCALAALAAGRELVVPEASASEAGLVPGALVSAASHLTEVIAALDGRQALRRVEPGLVAEPPASTQQLDDVRGHASAKRALVVAAAGEHNLLMIGPPGSGKTMLASRLPGLLPRLSDDELLEVAAIASVAGMPSVLRNGHLRPFRSPHHTTRAAALVGGGAHPRPGEISLAHRGVLFLDELPEFSRETLEALREPLETGRVSISRLGRRIDFPAQFQLIAAMNPCPCGFHGDGTDRCHCGPGRIQRYRSRVSGPLLDRFDLRIEVPPVAVSELTAAGSAAPGIAVQQQIRDARARQRERGILNSRLTEPEALDHARLDASVRRLLSDAQRRWRLSPRGVVRVLRVARTIADLAGNSRPGAPEVSEALHLRRLDRPHSADTV